MVILYDDVIKKSLYICGSKSGEARQVLELTKDISYEWL
jgi:hypothetical protein